MKSFTLSISFLLFASLTLAQLPLKHVTLNWYLENEANNTKAIRFDGCSYNQILKEIYPIDFHHIEVNNENYRMLLSDQQFNPIPGNITLNQTTVESNQNSVNQFITYESGKIFLNVEIFPFRRNSSSGAIEYLRSFQYQLVQVGTSNTVQKLRKKASYVDNSVLSNGDWHRFAIKQEGVYKITVSDLSAMGLNTSSIALSTMQIYGSRGGLIPEPLNDVRIDDLKEISVKVIDENGNDRMDGNDQILFFAEGPNAWKYSQSLNQFIHDYNIYDENNYIYVTHSQKNGLRINDKVSGQGLSFDKSISKYHHLLFHEQDLVNFIASGRNWYGESFGKQNQRNFSHTFDNVSLQDTAYLRQNFVGRSIQANSSYNVKVNGITWSSGTFSSVSGLYDDPYVDNQYRDILKPFIMQNAKVDLSYTFNPGSSGSDAWLDYYELSIPTDMNFGSGQQVIYLKETINQANIQLNMSGSSFLLWDITDHFNTGNQLMFSENGKLKAIINANNQIKRFVAFQSSSALKPTYIGKVNNQNLHAIRNIDFVIVTHPDFENQANRLAEFHRNQYNQTVAVVKTSEIYHEFGGGKKDASAIRDFLKMLYDRGNSGGTPFKFVCLFGDGTYDYKDRVDKNTNYIPTFQSRDSYNPSNSYGSDDYFAILDDLEGNFDVMGAKEGLDIGIGRIPCRNEEQARTAVDKIIRYHQPTGFGEWRNRLTFLGDDEDGNQHFDDSELVSAFLDKQNPIYNIEKIYLDAFEQVSFGSGEKYPDVNSAVDRNFDRGQFAFNYLGHGGPSGMAHERVVTRDQIRNWSNIDKLPVIITATCELSRYDDPAQDSPGELMLFNASGGAIALITTTRLVYINLNRDLNAKILDDNMFNFDNGKPYLGDVFKIGKNRSQKNVNQRNFSLLGDPAIILAYPKYEVLTTSINDSAIGVQSLDTFRAFSKMKITGEVRREDGSLATDFNGIVYPTMFDKFQTYTTLGNDPSSSPRTFKMQNSVLYRGKVSAINGKFSFQFVVPKDIAYQYGNGKLTYYAEDGIVDGNGLERDIVVGGSSSSVANDSKGPDIDLFIDDYSFVFGGISKTRPLFLCKVYDENGINTVGNGIGRDITAILDEGTDHEVILVLNDYYQSTLDSYQEGEIRYTSESLTPGRHTLKVRIWDVYNNSSEDYTEFIVAGDEKLSLAHVLNYPNPFTTHTDFHFDHNKAGQAIDVQIQVVSISGRVVKSMHQTMVSANSHFDAISWDGKDTYGDKLARGVYLYKVKVRSEDGDEAEVVEKLVLLK